MSALVISGEGASLGGGGGENVLYSINERAAPDDGETMSTA